MNNLNSLEQYKNYSGELFGLTQRVINKYALKYNQAIQAYFAQFLCQIDLSFVKEWFLPECG